MRVTSDRQTLILAGETPPPRTDSPPGTDSSPRTYSPARTDSPGDSGPHQVTIISARVDAVVTHGIYTSFVAPASSGAALPNAYAASLPALPPELHQAYVDTNAGYSYSAAEAYARTRDLAQKTHLIDTYA